MANTKEVTVLTTTISHCARCNGDHEDLEFKKFTNPIFTEDETRIFVEWSHWALCPNLGEPILLKINET